MITNDFFKTFFICLKAFISEVQGELDTEAIADYLLAQPDITRTLTSDGRTMLHSRITEELTQNPTLILHPNDFLTTLKNAFLFPLNNKNCLMKHLIDTWPEKFVGAIGPCTPSAAETGKILLEKFEPEDNKDGIVKELRKTYPQKFSKPVRNPSGEFDADAIADYCMNQPGIARGWTPERCQLLRKIIIENIKQNPAMTHNPDTTLENLRTVFGFSLQNSNELVGAIGSREPFPKPSAAETGKSLLEKIESEAIADYLMAQLDITKTWTPERRLLLRETIIENLNRNPTWNYHPGTFLAILRTVFGFSLQNPNCVMEHLKNTYPRKFVGAIGPCIPSAGKTTEKGRFGKNAP